MTSSGSDSATQGRLGQDVLHAPACTEAGIDREVGLDLNNVRLGTGFAGQPQVLQQVFALHCSYMRHLEHPNAVPTEGPAAFPHCPIFAKPPGYKHQLALLLEEEAAKFDPPSFAMRPAACIVDESRGADPHRAEATFAFFCRIAKESGLPCSRTPNSKAACTEDHVDHQVAVMIENFVVAVATEQQRRGMLTGEEGQVQRYRKSLTRAVKAVSQDFIGPKSSAKWADGVFTPSYRQNPLEQVFEFIDTYGHLPARVNFSST